MSDTKQVNLGRFGSAGLGIGLIGGLVSIGMLLSGDKIMAQSYLFAWSFFLALTLGFFGLMLLHHTVRGKWGLSILRIFEAGASLYTFGLLALLYIPILVQMFMGQSDLYKWTHPSVVAADQILKNKEPYLNLPFFTIRFVLFFLLWIGLAMMMRRSTRKQDENGNVSEEQKRSSFAAPGLVAFFLSITFAGTDWLMSLEPRWSSTMYGLWWSIGMGLMALSLTVIIVVTNRDREPYKGLVKPSLTRDWGNLLLTLTMLWGYTSVSQYLIIWSGNLPLYTSYFVNRSNHSWNAIGFATILGQFFIPFFLLCTPRIKATPTSLAKVAGWILVMRLIDSYQLVMPAFTAGTRTSPMPYAQDILALVGVAGLWTWAFCSGIRRSNLLPNYDPRLMEAEAHAH